MGEVELLLESLADANSKLTRAQSSLLAKEKEILEMRRRHEAELAQSNQSVGTGPPITVRLETLLKLWQGLGTPSEERVQVRFF